MDNRSEHSVAGGLVELRARRSDAVPLLAVAIAATGAWIYLTLLHPMPGGMTPTQMAGMKNLAPGSYGWPEGVLLFVMWAVMMVAMMVPSAAPMILLFSRIARARSARGAEYAPVGFFALGYLGLWWAFAAVAAFVQWELDVHAGLTADMRIRPLAAGLVLIAAGTYQWLPLKQACLRQCRTPLGFLSQSWREGPQGAVVMGLTHGAFCVGCCWLLMALLFAAGVMNLLWVAALSIIVLLEKTFTQGPVISRILGIILIGAGVVQLVRV
ncbi:MAG: DUF2182 domain-containing protein [Gemmatimonadaceae bacterium]